MKLKSVSGFTLLEVCLVLVVVGVVLGGLMQPLLNNREQLLQRQAAVQLDEIRSALMGYAASRGALPCPATATSLGSSVAAAGGCETYSGFVPSVELGVSGAIDSAGLLLDPWSKRLVYVLSSVDADENGEADFAVIDGMRQAGLSELQGDLSVSHWSGEDCDSLQLRASRLVAVIHSDGAKTHDSRAEQLNRVADRQFATGAYSQAQACGFDDQLRWISDSALFTQMLRAQRLP